MIYDRLSDIRMRLEGTLVRYKGQPVYIEQAFETDSTASGFCVEGYFLRSRKPFRADPNSSLMDSRAFSLGYINTGSCAKYLKRKPLRHYKQGLTTYTSGAKELNKMFNNLVLGLYPSLFEAKILMKNGWESVALSRVCAVNRNKILYKDVVVGRLVKNKIVLDKEYKYLRNYLEVSNENL